MSSAFAGDAGDAGVIAVAGVAADEADEVPYAPPADAAGAWHATAVRHRAADSAATGAAVFSRRRGVAVRGRLGRM